MSEEKQEVGPLPGPMASADAATGLSEATLVIGDETAWLIEETWSGYVHYIHRSFDAASWRREANSIADLPYLWVPNGGGATLTRRRPKCLFITKDANEAMRFASRAVADAWIAAQPNWFNYGDQYQAREHMWPEPSGEQP